MSVACSVLYRPFTEMDLDEPYGAPPESAYYTRLIELLEATETRDRARRRVVVQHRRRPRARNETALRALHRGRLPPRRARPTRSTAHVHDLAARGVLYITLAHLFWRRVATNTPALPFLPDPSTTCSSRRRACPRSRRSARPPCAPCTSTGILVDISHMREDAIDATFNLIEALDRETGADPRDYPVIASHAGYRFGAPALQPHRRDDRADRGPRRRGRADLRPAPDQRRPAPERHEDAQGVARRARPPHRRDRPRPRRDRLRPRRVHQADDRRRRVRRGPAPFAAALRALPGVGGRRCSRATRCGSSGRALPAQHPDAAHLHPDLAARVDEPQQHGVAVRAAQHLPMPS